MDTPERIAVDGTSALIYHVHSTPSTNDLAANLLTDTATPTPHLTTIIADRQSAGRGRLGRTWIAPEGEASLASTVVSLPTSIPTDQLGWLVYACGLAVRDALARRLEPLDHSVCLKWPNDVLVDGERKICGILAQLAPASSPRSSSATASTLPNAPITSPPSKPPLCTPRATTRQPRQLTLSYMPSLPTCSPE